MLRELNSLSRREQSAGLVPAVVEEQHQYNISNTLFFITFDDILYSMLDDNIVTMDESRKWVLQTLENLRAFQIELYDLVQEEYHLVNEHKLACDNVHNDTLSEQQRMDAYTDSCNLRKQMNERLDSVLSKYQNMSF